MGSDPVSALRLACPAMGADLFDVEEVRGGSPLDAGCIAGPTGARKVSAVEMAQAKHLGKKLVEAAIKLKA